MKIDLRKILINLSCFFVLFYPFNSTIAGKIYPMYSLTYISVFFSLFLLVILSKKKSITKFNVLILMITLILILIEVVNNCYINKSKMILFTIYLLLPFVMSLNHDSIRGFEKCMYIFSAEHIIFTYIPVFFRNFYVSYILPFLDSAQSESLATSHFKSGFNPGLTTHYSTNGMYLSIICIFFFARYLQQKSKKDCFLVLISLIALLMTGKRGHAIFTIITFIIMFFIINKDKISKKVFNFSIISISAIIFLYAIASFIPQVTIVFERFMNNINNGTDLLTGRGEFYDLALKLWNNNILLGNGWGSFSNYYQIYLFSTFGVSYLDAHNVYIQLLCETGIIGATFIIGLMALIELKTLLILKKVSVENKIVIAFSFGYQLFFLLYCFSGNPLYDPQCYVAYFMSIGIFIIVCMKEMRKKYEKN